MTPLHLALLTAGGDSGAVVAALLDHAEPRDLRLIVQTEAGQSIGMLELAMQLGLPELHRALARKYPR